MSFSDKVLTNASSPTISRRVFTRQAIFAAITTAAITASTAMAAEPGFIPETPTVKLTGSSTSSKRQDSAATIPHNGQFIADFALQFVGYPYVWAGNTPSGFDCSGFTEYVILNTVGYDIGHASQTQMNYGTWVDAANLAPGDLVFFANTWGPGVTHAGVYIGDGQFVHAENEGTGVTISWLWSDYYGGHYCGAMRHW